MMHWLHQSIVVVAALTFAQQLIDLAIADDQTDDQIDLAAAIVSVSFMRSVHPIVIPEWLSDWRLMTSAIRARWLIWWHFDQAGSVNWIIFWWRDQFWTVVATDQFAKFVWSAVAIAADAIIAAVQAVMCAVVSYQLHVWALHCADLMRWWAITLLRIEAVWMMVIMNYWWVPDWRSFEFCLEQLDCYFESYWCIAADWDQMWVIWRARMSAHC